MNRRKAIIGVSIAGVGVAGLLGGYKWFSMNRSPDLAYLDKETELIASLAETIIPRTDTPGARDAGVQDFIILMLKDCTTTREQNTFINGLKDIQEYARTNYGKKYQDCTTTQQEAALKNFQRAPVSGIMGKVKNRLLGRSFFSILREYTVEGYCTSRAGATEGLAYLSVPGSYEACIPLKPGQRAWATN